MTQRQRRRLRRRRGSPGKKILLAIGILAAVVGIGVGAAAAWVISIYDSAPALASLQPIKKGRITQVYAADGSRIGVIHADNIRQPVPGEKIPQDLKDATVAIEDKNYYEHGGIDYTAIIRAGWKDALAGGKPVQGGSTITQQLVRNLYISDPQETIKRKIIEAHLANDEEAAHSKSWILNKYLNTAPYGTNNGATAIGVEAAAETYFSKHASELALPEAAMIAGLPQAPSEYNPFLNPRAAIARRNDVLLAMHQQGYISSSEYTRRGSRGPRPRPKPEVQPHHAALHLRPRQAAARRQVRPQHGGQRRPEGLYDDPAASPEAAQQAVDACSVCYAGGGPASALASVNPKTGEIVALASTQRFSQDNQFNFAAQAHRQPGSSFKTFVLTTAIKDGADPNATYYNGNSPKTLDIPGGGTLGGRERRARRRHLRPDGRDPGVGERRLRPARARRRPGELRQDRLRDGDHLAARDQARSEPLQARAELLHPARPTRSAASASASRRSRWRTPTRPSPTGESTTPRRRSRRWSSPTARPRRPPPTRAGAC